MNSNPTLKYEQEFSKCSLNQISKFFKIFDDISELLPELKKRIENSKIINNLDSYYMKNKIIYTNDEKYILNNNI